MPRGDLFILSAPSGTGKTTLIHSMLRGGTGSLRDLVFSVSHTTRPPRQGEVDGTDYHFVDHDTFQKMIAADRFLEWAQYNQNFYGTAWDEVVPRLEQGVDVIMDIDVQGAERVLQRYPEAIGIFVMPPSFAELRERLERRSLDEIDSVRRRLALSFWEIKRYKLYHYAIINNDAARASEALAAIILARRHRRERMEERAEAVLRDFEEAFGGDPLDAPEA
ncbi:MAG TPA: guanylate kinase [Thermoanaerobaculia bacterium]|jgi:guanylate kinase|nr:guanylate kinase [Thermoanaerobaculia bacterium]